MNRLMAPLVLVAALSGFSLSNGLVFNDPPRRRNQRNGKVADIEDRVFINSRRYSATQHDIEATWSKSGTRESRLGVRRRVRAVLAKARERTGVSNDSETGVSGQGGDDDMMLDSNLSMEASLGDWSFSPNNAEETTNGSGSDVLGSDPNLSIGVTSKTNKSQASVLKYTPDKQNGNGHPVSNGKSAPAFKPGPAIKQVAADNMAVQSAKKEGIAQQAAQQPLPFALPALTPEQIKILDSGERVQEQSKMGGEGSGFVVMDIKAPDYAIWEVLLDFERYPENIGTVRSMTMFTNTHLGKSFYAEKPLPPGTVVRHYGKASISRAKFVLSKFRLNIAAVHRYQPHPEGDYMIFTLDKACKNVVLQDAKGIWYLEPNPGGKKGVTRVWLLCELKVSNLLPTFIVDYAAQRAMPRATNWLAPAVETYLQQEKRR